MNIPDHDAHGMRARSTGARAHRDSTDAELTTFATQEPSRQEDCRDELI